MDMGLKDYDFRTALHIAAAEGELGTISLSVFLIFAEGKHYKMKYYRSPTLVEVEV